MSKVKLILLLFLLSSCEKCKESTNEQLCYKSEEFNSGNLRLDGYYYRQIDDSPARREIIFLYMDGTMLHGEMVDMDELAARELDYSNGAYYSSIKENEHYWGSFKVSGGWIAYEKWYPSTNYWLAYIRDGEILNDSTFRIVKSYRCDGSEQRAKDELFQFKHFPSKPDSTNKFVN